MKELSRLEEILLLAIWRLKENAYGVAIRKLISDQTGKEMSYGALYFALDQIYNKGYVSKTAGDPTPVRGGCRKIYYSLRPEGKKALKNTYTLQQTIWDGLSIVKIERG
ncbi:PadR family transcriptional regulator [candidate division KSB1 bacterium]